MHSHPQRSTGPRASDTSLWRDIAHALKGRRFDYTAEKPERAIVLLAVPMMLEMLMESLFAFVDVFWVARLGRDAIAVVGLVEAVMTLIYAVAIGISFAATAIVARRIGEQDLRSAAQVAGQMIALGLSLSALLGVALGCLAPQILSLMGAPAGVINIGTDFARVMLGGNVTVFMIFLINAIFRGAGDAAIAMRTLCLANGVNFILAPCLIFGWGPFPQLGVTGAAVSTNISRALGVMYQLWQLAGRGSSIHLRLVDLWPTRAVTKVVARTAGPGIAQMLISTTSWVGLFKILAMFGSAALAGYTIAIRLIHLVMLLALGLANAAATLVGQNLGAGKPDRAEAVVRLAVRFNALAFGGIGILLISFSHPLMSLLTSDPGVIYHGARALCIVGLGLPLYAAGSCLIAAFNGAGDTWTPTRLNFFCFWVAQIPLAWILSSVMNFGASGVFTAVLLSFSMLAVWSGVAFKRGAWRAKRV